ncbi:MAG: hypothetical protein WAX67_03560, partial [Rugosibacter sp.]
MSLLPRSLFGRNVLLIMALIIISQAVSLLMLYVFVQRARLAELATFTASYVEALDTALAHLPDAER